jgi:hypothetical protein
MLRNPQSVKIHYSYQEKVIDGEKNRGETYVPEKPKPNRGVPNAHPD